MDTATAVVMKTAIVVMVAAFVVATEIRTSSAEILYCLASESTWSRSIPEIEIITEVKCRVAGKLSHG